MRVAAESTSKIVELIVDGPVGHRARIEARVWEATTEAGVECLLFVTRVAVRENQDTAQFDEELAEQRAPSEEVRAWPISMIL